MCVLVEVSIADSSCSPLMYVDAKTCALVGLTVRLGPHPDSEMSLRRFRFGVDDVYSRGVGAVAVTFVRDIEVGRRRVQA